MPLLDVQRRGQQIGRLRIGQQVPSSKPGKMKPVRLETFRFTTGSRYTADAIADLYGGTVVAWGNQWEVITGRNAIEVVVPPRDQVISQWYEMWTKGGCLRRCDSQTEQKTGGPCLCPHAEDPTNPDEVEAAARERDRLAKMNPPRACQRKTRIAVMIPDLPGLGVFRLDTSSFYAAGEVLDAGDLMQAARDRDVFLPAIVRIDNRERVEDGQTKKFPVPVLEVMATFRQIVSGELSAAGMAAQLPPAPPQQRRALTSGQPAQNPAPVAALPEPEPVMDAQQIADRAAAVTTREEVEVLAERAKEARVEDDTVQTSPDTFEELKDLLRRRWKELPPEGGEAA